MSDWGTTTTKPDPNAKYDPVEAFLCIRAGNDLIMPGGERDVQNLLEAVRQEYITRADLKYCAERILALAKRTRGQYQ